MAIPYPTLAPARSNQLAPGPSMPNILGTAGRIGAGILTGGTSEIVSQVLSLIPSIFQGITGRRQLRQANQIEAENPRPEAVVAPSIDRLGNYAYGQTLSQDIPGGELYRNEIKGATSAGLRAASELGTGAEAYGMLGELVGREQNSFAELAKLTADRVAGKESAYANTLLSKADEENRVWEWNKAQPYLQAAQTAAMLRDSGLKNVNSGVKDVFGSTAEAVSPDFNSTVTWGNDNSRTGGSIDSATLRKMIQEALNG